MIYLLTLVKKEQNINKTRIQLGRIIRFMISCFNAHNFSLDEFREKQPIVSRRNIGTIIIIIVIPTISNN